MTARKGPRVGPEELKALRDKLAERERAPAKRTGPVRPSPPTRREGSKPSPVPVPPASTEPPREPPRSFDEEMARSGVKPGVPRGPDRVPLAAGKGSSRPVALRDAASAADAASAPGDGEDAGEALWKNATRGTRRARDGAPEGRPAAWPTLDLHGFAEADAIHALRQFVALHAAPSARWVRVITGRGAHGTGVVREASARWLRQSPAVAAFRPAEPADGGDGVLLVQLKRQRRP